MMQCLSSSGSEGNIVQSAQNTDFGSFENSLGFRIEDAINLSRSMYWPCYLLIYNNLNFIENRQCNFSISLLSVTMYLLFMLINMERVAALAHLIQ